MSALTSLLARDHVVPVRKIEEALQRQVVSGGDITTLLLEAEALPENTLAAYCAALHGLLPATRDEVMRVPRDTVRIVPREIAERHRMVPLAVDGRVLVVAMAEPLKPEGEEQLGFLLGFDLVTRIVCEVRLAAALLHHYGIEAAPRLRRLIEKLRHRDAGEVPYVAPQKDSKLDRVSLELLPRKKVTSASSWLDDDDEADDDELELGAPPPVVSRPSQLPEGRITEPMGVPRATAPVAAEGAPAQERPTRYDVPPPRSTDHDGTASGELEAVPRAEAAEEQAPAATIAEAAARVRPEVAEEEPHVEPPRPPATAPQSVEPAQVLGVGVRSSRPPAPRERPAWTPPEPAAVEPAVDAALPPVAVTAPVRDEPLLSSPGRLSAPGETPAARAIRRLRGPLTAAAAVRLLEESTQRDEILEVLFAFARQFFDCAALFTLHDEVAAGRDAWGASADAVRGLRIPLSEPGTFAEVRRGLVPRIAAFEVGASDAKVLACLGRAPGTIAITLPLAIRGRPVLLVYGDRGGDPFELGDLPELVAFVPRVVEALERLILRKKKKAATPFTRGATDHESRAALKAAARTVGTGPLGSLPAVGAKRASPDRWSSTAELPAATESAEALVDAIASTGIASAPIAAPSAEEEPAAPAAPPGPRNERSRKPTLRSLLGIPRSAPPPPTSSDLGLPAPAVVVAEAALPTAVPTTVAGPAAEPAPQPAPGASPPASAREDDEPELTLDAADPSEFDDIDDRSDPALRAPRNATPTRSSRAAPGQTYSFRDASVDVVGRRRTSSRPPRRGSIAPTSSVSGTRPMPATREEHSDENDFKSTRPDRPSALDPRVPPVRRADPRREDGAPEAVADVVSVPATEPPARGSVAPSSGARASTAPGARARERPSTPMSEELPSVIVDMGDQVNALVHDLISRGPDDESSAVESLLRLGEVALPVLAQAFPGPLWFDRSRAHRRVPRGRDVSAIARALHAFRDRAVPYVASLLGSSHAERRFYAALLATELPHPGLVDALAQRAFDEDEGVRRYALEALAQCRGFAAEWQEMIVVLRRAAKLRGRDQNKRRLAATALGAIRDEGGLRVLVELLDDEDGALIEAAHGALVALTCEDLGTSSKRWLAWAQKNEKRHRIEWLIDALVHADEGIRTMAGEELKHLTQQYYGYHPASPRKEREKVQQKYRRWWDEEGHARYAPAR